MKVACPRCGANVTFIPSTQKCFCEYCGSEIAIDEFEIKEFESDTQDAQVQNVQYDEYTCSTCGAKLITDEETTITDCVYCGSRQILKEKLQGEFKPQEVLPFKIDREQFIQMYKTFVKKKVLAPEEFKNNPRLLETKGIYIPFQLFFFDIDAYARGEAIQRNKDNTSYKYFELEISEKILSPQDASVKFNDDIMTTLEPFNFKELTQFHPAYLNGFMAENGNEELEQLERKAEARGIAEVQKDIYKRTKHHTMTNGKMNVNFKKLENRYVLLPVWFLNTWYQNKIYSYAVNGQTGKIVGEIPLSKPKFTAVMAAICTLAVVLTLFFLIISGASDEGEDVIDIIIGIWACVAIIYATIKKRYKNVNKVLENPLETWEKKEKCYREFSKGQYKKTFGDAELKNHIQTQLFRNGTNVKELLKNKSVEE